MRSLDFNQMGKIAGGGSGWDYFSCGLSTGVSCAKALS